MRKGLLAATVISSGLWLSACNTSFDLGFTSDDHVLKSNPVGGTGDFAATTHPVVLVHGAYGFVDIFGLDYWYDITDVLELNGATVHVARVSGTTTPERRGDDLIVQLDGWGGGPFHLFGHSLGAPTIRYVAQERPDLVASITSVAGANFGSEAAENDDSLDVPLIGPIRQLMGNLLGHVIDVVTQESFEQNVYELTQSMTVDGSNTFNDAYPAGLSRNPDKTPSTCNGTDATNGFSSANGGGNAPIYAESGNGNDPWSDFQVFYQGDIASDANSLFTVNPGLGNEKDIYFYSFGGNFAATNDQDPLDSLHTGVSKDITGDDDDGFLERCSSHLGYVVKDNFTMNHLDFMNWFIGLRHADSPYPPAIYLAHLHHLRVNKGL